MRESTSLFDVNAAFSLGQSPARVLLSGQWVKSFRADDTVIQGARNMLGPSWTQALLRLLVWAPGPRIDLTRGVLFLFQPLMSEHIAQMGRLICLGFWDLATLPNKSFVL